MRPLGLGGVVRRYKVVIIEDGDIYSESYNKKGIIQSVKHIRWGPWHKMAMEHVEDSIKVSLSRVIGS